MIVELKDGCLTHEKEATLYRKALAGADQLILFHGTSDIFKNDILAGGLKPRRMTENEVYGKPFRGCKNIFVGGLPSNPNWVYLGDYRVALNRSMNTIDAHGGERIVFRYLVETRNLVPDEDSKGADYLESLIDCGTCASTLPLTPEQLLGYYDFSNFDWRNGGGEIYVPLRQSPKIDRTLDRDRKCRLTVTDHNQKQRGSLISAIRGIIRV